jgi:hypothetical protein
MKKLIDAKYCLVVGLRRGEGPLAPTVQFETNGFSCWFRRGVQLYAPTVRFEIIGVLL